MIFPAQLHAVFRNTIATAQEKTRSPGFLKNAAFFLLLFLLLSVVGSRLPEGFDWRTAFKVGAIPTLWTPWTGAVLKPIAPFGYGPIFAITIMSIAVHCYRRKRSPLPIALALLSLPTLWVLYIGNLDGLVLFGMLIMPFGVPLVAMKPQLAAFALLAKKSWFLAAAVWGILSLLIWGPWPLNFLVVTSQDWHAEWTQDITLFPWGLLVGLPLLWFSRGDEDLLMAAGSFMTPHLFPYHFILLMPALARMSWPWMLLCWAVSWAPLFAANAFGDIGWRFGNLLGLCIWAGVFFNKDKNLRQGLFIR